MQLIRLCDSKNSLYGRNSFLVFAYFFEEHSWPLNWFKTETCILWTCLPAQNHSTCTSEWGGAFASALLKEGSKWQGEFCPLDNHDGSQKWEEWAHLSRLYGVCGGSVLKWQMSVIGLWMRWDEGFRFSLMWFEATVSMLNRFDGITALEQLDQWGPPLFLITWGGMRLWLRRICSVTAHAFYFFRIFFKYLFFWTKNIFY